MNISRFFSIGSLLACFLLAGVSCGGSSSGGQKIYFVAIGEMRSVRLDALRAYYKQRYDLTIEILPPILGLHLDVVGQDAQGLELVLHPANAVREWAGVHYVMKATVGGHHAAVLEMSES